MVNMSGSKRARQQDSIKNKPTCGGNKKSGLVRFIGMDSSISLARFGIKSDSRPVYGMNCPGNFSIKRNQTCAGGVGKHVTMRHCGNGDGKSDLVENILNLLSNNGNTLFSKDVLPIVKNLAGYILVQGIVNGNGGAPERINKETIENFLYNLVTLLLNTALNNEKNLTATIEAGTINGLLPEQDTTVTIKLPDITDAKEFYTSVATSFVDDLSNFNDEISTDVVFSGILNNVVKARDTLLKEIINNPSTFADGSLSSESLDTSANGFLRLYEVAEENSDSNAVPRAIQQQIFKYATNDVPDDTKPIKIEIKFEPNLSLGDFLPVIGDYELTLPPQSNTVTDSLIANNLASFLPNIEIKKRNDANQKIGMVIAFSVFSRPFPVNGENEDENITLGERKNLIGENNFESTNQNGYGATGLAGGDVAFFVSVILKAMERWNNLQENDISEFLSQVDQAVTVSDLVNITQFQKNNPQNREEALNLLREFVPFGDDAITLADGFADTNDNFLTKIAKNSLISDSYDENTLDAMLNNYWPVISGLKHASTSGVLDTYNNNTLNTYQIGYKMVNDNSIKFDELVYKNLQDSTSESSPEANFFKTLITKAGSLVLGTNLVQLTDYNNSLGMLISKSIVDAVKMQMQM